MLESPPVTGNRLRHPYPARVAPEPEELEVATRSRESIDAKSRALTPAATVARVGGRGVLGIAILERVITRFINRLLNPPPPLAETAAYPSGLSVLSHRPRPIRRRTHAWRHAVGV